MKLTSKALLFFLFSINLVYGQNSLNDFITVKLIDSLKNANGYGVLGYKSLHLKSTGNTVYLAAKKIWVQDGVDTATITLGKRVNGHWEFSDIHSTNEQLIEKNVQLSLDVQNSPVVFYNDQIFENGWAKHGIVNVLHNQNDIWENFTAITFTNEATKGDQFEEFGFGANPGFIMLEDYWSDEQQRGYSAYSVYDDQTATLSPAVIYNLDSLTQYYNSFTWPAVTEDGEYFAHSCVIPTSTENLFNIGLFVYKKESSNQWTLDFEYVSDTLFSAWPYWYPFGTAIGKDLNGDIFLLAKNDIEHPFFKKSNGTWIKIEDNYPVANGVESPGASNRSLNNEKIQFASDGTAFWGDMDGGPTYAFSAETSFRTPDGHWGVIYCPPAPGYNSDGGQFWRHDFTITSDDSLIIVYEFVPYDGNFQKVYLLEAKASIPEIVNYVTALQDPANDIMPGDLALFQNYPNPFNPETKIKFHIPRASFVSLKIYNTLGREVKTLVNEPKSPGTYEVTFDASGLSSGIYFYTLNTGSTKLTKRMLLVK